MPMPNREVPCPHARATWSEWRDASQNPYWQLWCQDCLEMLEETTTPRTGR